MAKSKSKDSTKIKRRVWELQSQCVHGPEKYEYFPETVSSDHYKSDEFQRVAVYARVSTDDVRQTSSFELQKTYYE